MLSDPPLLHALVDSHCVTVLSYFELGSRAAATARLRAPLATTKPVKGSKPIS